MEKFIRKGRHSQTLLMSAHDSSSVLKTPTVLEDYVGGGGGPEEKLLLNQETEAQGAHHTEGK